eukprot:CAMPEP_0184481982 /NCGR_PEP_ID=MMETSP0113_2-20130426/3573_1 /TAXON_ID=91329 /ORGANISM="Norrisiella sphaerica, Strain BC52" /LENGTH=565 /DNA_ID=CAMNT_0026861481 /DNA_START=277 /DNA_END=1974 /DNA_ORIENTATION=+
MYGSMGNMRGPTGTKPVSPKSLYSGSSTRMMKRSSKSPKLKRRPSVLDAAFHVARRNARERRRLQRQRSHKGDSELCLSPLPPSGNTRAQPLLGTTETSFRRINITEKRPHSWLYSMLNPQSKKPQARVYKYVMAVIISANTILFILSTIHSVNKAFGRFLYVHEGLVSSLFGLEYFIRLAVITESRHFRHPVWGRLSYLTSFAAMIDGLSFLPFFVEIIFSQNLPTLTYLRVLRLVRILKTESYAAACASAARVIRFNSEILVVAFMMCGMLLLFTSTILYYLRPGLGDSSGSDPDSFLSIPDCMYLAILMLTGQGVPDGILPWYTKMVVVTTAVFSVAMFAIPSSMLTWGFEAEAERMARVRYLKEQQRREYIKIHKEEPPPSDSSESSWGWDVHDTSDEDYFRQIAGISSGSDDDDEEKREAKNLFSAADRDASKGLSFEEFWNLFKKVKHQNDGSVHLSVNDVNPPRHGLDSLRLAGDKKSSFTIERPQRCDEGHSRNAFAEGSSANADATHKDNGSDKEVANLLKMLLEKVDAQGKRIDELVETIRKSKILPSSSSLLTQ